MNVRIGRVYEERSFSDGTRVLVDRLWPRGMTKARADVDAWCKKVAPSTELRTWYRGEPDRFEAFSHRYQAELALPEQAAALAQLRELAARGTLTLLTASKRPELSKAAVLADLLRH
jgi:uncharacterized protein YeaO (DUF488 family)